MLLQTPLTFPSTSLQEPEKAIETYEQALRKNPRNPGLACKTGRALVQTHQYGKAVNYYREAVRGDADPQLRLDMALLCLKLGQLEKADSTLTQVGSRVRPVRRTALSGMGLPRRNTSAGRKATLFPT